MPQDQSHYVFGNSLFNHVSTEGTTVAHWLDLFAETAGHSYAINGEFGFLRNFADREEPLSQWGFPGVDSALAEEQAFGDVAFDQILIVPANFIQDQSPATNYAGDTRSPFDALVDLIDGVLVSQPGAEIVIYEGWADMGPFSADIPVDPADLAAYHAYNMGAYHEWYVSLVDALNADDPSRNVKLLPVASLLSELLSIVLSDIPSEALYTDSAPHGTETLYFLAALIVYQDMYGELPPELSSFPATVHAEVEEHYQDILVFLSGTGVGGVTGIALTGTSAAEELTGGTADDTLTGESGDDTLSGGTGDDTLNGGENTDTAAYDGDFDEFVFGYDGSLTLRDTEAGNGDEGTDHLLGIEVLTFGDGYRAESGGTPDSWSVFDDTDTLVATIIMDVTEAYGWESRVDTLGAGGTLSQRGYYWADGDYRLVSYDSGGAVVTRQDFDESETQLWSSRTDSFDGSGNLTQRVFLLDSGEQRTRTYSETGELISFELADLGTLHSWTTITSTYDSSQTLMQKTIVYDDGRITTSSFDDGDLAELEQLRLNGDTVTTQFDEAGLRETVTVEDGSNTRGWQTKTTTYDVLGEVTSVEFVWDLV